MRNLRLLLLTIIAVAFFVWLRPLALGGPASYIVVNGISMEPTLYTGDLAVLQRQAGYAQGDIVGFLVDNRVVIHRIIGGSAEAGYVMQGDNKPAPDMWQPRPPEILGRMRFHIPKAGQWLANLRQPHLLLGLGLAAILSWDEVKKAKTRRHIRHFQARARQSVAALQPSGGWLELLAVIAGLTLVLGLAAGYGYYLPLTKTETVQQPLYQHGVAFQYTVHTAPSELYPTERVGPIGPENAAEAAPVLSSLVRAVVIDVSYRMEDAQPQVLKGELSVAMRFKSGEDWSRTEQLLAPTPFDGTAASAQVTLDMALVQPFIDAITEQLGYNPGNFAIEIIPTVNLIGQLDGRGITDAFAPVFALTLNPTRMAFDTELTRSEARTADAQEVRPNALKFAGISVPVQALRTVGLAGTVVGLILSVLLSAVVFLGLGMDEVGRLRARYGGMLVSVAAANLESSQRIEVASMPDLVRLARRDGGFIFHETQGDLHLFFVPDGLVTYTYRVGQSRLDT
jgi:signal peptidase